MPLRIRLLGSAELGWANTRYAEVDFLPSAPDDLIALAETDGNPAGLARVTRFSPQEGELGGMYVFPEYRRAGISSALIRYLIAEASVTTLYCLPFDHLRALYESHGFELISDVAGVPTPVLKKHRWCNRHYPKPVLLMRRTGLSSVIAACKSRHTL